MVLLTETTSPAKMPGKRLFEEGSHQNPKNSSKFNRSNTDSARTFPMHCDGQFATETERPSPGFSGSKNIKASNAFSFQTAPMHCGGSFAPEIERTSPGVSGVKDIDEMSNAPSTVAAPIDAKPLRIVAPSEMKNEYEMKNDDHTVLSTRGKLSPKNGKFRSAIASRKLDEHVLLPKTRDDSLNLRTSPMPLHVASDHQNGTANGEIELKSTALSNWKSNPGTKPFKMKAESNKESAGDEDDDCVIVMEKSNNVFQRNLVKDQFVSSTLAQKNSSQCLQGQTSRGYEIKGEEDDEDVCFLSASEWKDLLQSGFKSHNNNEKDNGAEFSVGKIGKQSEIYWVEDFTKESAEGGKDGSAETSIGKIGKPFEIYWVEDFTKVSAEGGNDGAAETSVGKIDKPFEIYWVEDFTKENTEETEANDLKNMNIIPYDAATDIFSRNNVQKARSLYDELFNSLIHEYKEKFKGEKFSSRIYVKAAMLLRKEQKWVNVEPSFGHVPGVEIGDQFEYRAELALVGLHHELMAGINYVTIKGKNYAISVVDSGRYKNKVKSPNVLVYSGHGGLLKTKANNLEDQKLEGGNLALKNSMDAKLPVRVIRKTVLLPDATNKKMYIYDGLYLVNRFWPERSENGKLALMFELVRMSGQPDCNHLTISKPRVQVSGQPDCNHLNISKARSMENLDHSRAVTTYDVSQGKEKVPIMVVNDVNNEKPAPFAYMTKMMYPHSFELAVTSGCHCIGGCSDSVNCPCSVKNNGELPFNEEGAIVKAKQMVYECGPNCKCPPSCQNRVSQHGPRFPLQVFKTKSTGWGVRSPVEIPSGSFICEYIGELLEDKEADQRSNDEYLFDLDDGNGFTIDAAEYGNVGRFINHSCTPNLYAQNVLYDHNDKRLPHVMFFATRNIPALKELTYDYNYKLDRVCDANGNIKKKECCCGSRKCSGRMY